MTMQAYRWQGKGSFRVARGNFRYQRRGDGWQLDALCGRWELTVTTVGQFLELTAKQKSRQIATDMTVTSIEQGEDAHTQVQLSKICETLALFFMFYFNISFVKPCVCSYRQWENDDPAIRIVERKIHNTTLGVCDPLGPIHVSVSLLHKIYTR